MRTRLFILLAMAWLSAVQGNTQPVPTATFHAIVTTTLENRIHPEGRHAQINAQFYFDGNGRYIFSGAAGVNKKGDTLLPKNFRFKSASVSKTITAVLVLQLAEEKRIHLDSAVGHYLDRRMVEKLVRINGKPVGHTITIRQLLNHTSGLADYLFDDNRFMLRLTLFPGKSYVPEQHLRRYVRHRLHRKTKTAPGTAFHYADTNYLLLALLVEKITGNTFENALHNRIAVPLQLQNTFTDNHDSAYRNMMHQYHNRRDITQKLHPSVESGGGGLITTTEDLAAFMKALFNGKLLQPETLAEMTRCNTADYGLGLMRMKIPMSYIRAGATDTLIAYGHDGYFGVSMYHIPEHNITWVWSSGQSDPPPTHQLPAWLVALRLYLRD